MGLRGFLDFSGFRGWGLGFLGVLLLFFDGTSTEESQGNHTRAISNFKFLFPL